MITFCIALLVLIGGYFIYGKFIERVFGIEPDRKTPAIKNPDGVDFVPLPRWKIFMIQFLQFFIGFSWDFNSYGLIIIFLTRIPFRRKAINFTRS